MHPHFRSFASRDEGAGIVAALEQGPVTIPYVDHRGRATGYLCSAPVTVNTRPPMNPTNFRATAQGGDVVLTWDAIPEASLYWIAEGPGIATRKPTEISYTVRNVPPGTNTYGLIAYYEGGPDGATDGDETNPARVTVLGRIAPEVRDLALSTLEMATGLVVRPGDRVVIVAEQVGGGSDAGDPAPSLVPGSVIYRIGGGPFMQGLPSTAPGIVHTGEPAELISARVCSFIDVRTKS